MATVSKAKGKKAPKAKAKGKKAPKVTESRTVKALPFQTNGIVAGLKGSSFSVSGVEYKGYVYPSLWQVWGKRGTFQSVNHAGPDGLDIGSRAQCIAFRKLLRAAKPGTKVTFKNEKDGHKGSNKVHVFRTVKPGTEV